MKFWIKKEESEPELFWMVHTWERNVFLPSGMTVQEEKDCETAKSNSRMQLLTENPEEKSIWTPYLNILEETRKQK